MLLFLLTLPVVLLLFLIFMVQFIRYKMNRIAWPKKSLLLLAFMSSVCVGSFLVNYYFFTFNTIDRTNMQEGRLHVKSPDGEWSASSYYELYGGAPGGVNVWVEVTNEQTTETKIVYYADAKQDVSLTWEDNQMLTIRNEDQYNNATTTVNVQKDIYDEFGRACRSIAMRGQYEYCYQADE